MSTPDSMKRILEIIKASKNDEEIRNEEAENDVIRNIKIAAEEEGFYSIGVEWLKGILKRIKFEDEEIIKKVVHNIMERYGEEGLSVLKYVEFENIEEDSLLSIFGELEDIPILREVGKLVRKMKNNEFEEQSELTIDWETQYRKEEVKRKEAEDKLKFYISKYNAINYALQKKIPHPKHHSEKDTKKVFDLFMKKDLKNFNKALTKDPTLIFIEDEDENTLLHKGVDNEWIEGMQVVIDHAVGVEGFVDKKDHYGETALTRACYDNKVKVAEFLIMNGANLEDKDDCEFTALWKAVMNKKFEVAELLISKGANIETKDKSGFTILKFELLTNKFDTVEFLISKGANVTAALIAVCLLGDIKKIEYLYSKGANINAKDEDGRTVLMNACMGGNIEVVEYLIMNGANVNAKDNDGETALTIESELGKSQIVEYLVSKGANVNHKTNNGQTALMKACLNNNFEVVKFLISKGANVNHKANNGQTALMKACLNENLETVEYLISKGAEIEAKDNNGETALMKASLSGNHKVYEYLVSKGANTEVKDNNGETALMKKDRVLKKDVLSGIKEMFDDF